MESSSQDKLSYREQRIRVWDELEILEKQLYTKEFQSRTERADYYAHMERLRDQAQELTRKISMR